MNAATTGTLFHISVHYEDNGEFDSHVGRFADSVDAVMCAQEVMDGRAGKVTVRALNRDALLAAAA